MKKEPNKRINYLVPFLFAIYIALLVWIILLKLQFSINELDTIRKINLIPFHYDNGIGIDKKYHGKIFAKFVQLDSAYTKKESSTGLGLTITKELVELHGGKISLISEINNGSTFIVEIPF